MQKDSLRDLYIDELRDLYSAETQLVKALPKLAKASSSNQLREAFEEHLRQTSDHVSRLERIFEQQSDGTDLVLLVPIRFGIGFGLPHPVTTPYIPSGEVAFWGGWGGSLIVNDLDRRMTFAYVMNKMSAGIIGSARSDAYLRAVYESRD